MTKQFKTITTIFLLLFLSFSSLNIKATECVDRTFKEEFVNLYLCQNHSNYNETRTLLFKTRAKILNEYIAEKIKLGQLTNKKFEIQLYDVALTNNHLNISQGKNDYFVTYSGFATFQQLKIIVDYFANKDWKPFFTRDNEKSSDASIDRQINQFFAEHKTSEITLPQQNVWTLDNLRLDYTNDTLRYYLNSILLDIQATSSLPVKIQDRFLLFQSNTIFVVQGQSIIKTQKIAQPITEDYDIYTTEKWVNICYGGKDNWVYSYSYDKNCFYKRKD
jgi:hypothetical protein